MLIKFSLLLLGLHALVTMALEELKVLSKDILEPLSHDPARKIHAKALNDISKPYKSFARQLRKDIGTIAPGHSLIKSASMDIDYPSHSLTRSLEDPAKLGELVHKYEDLGHHGIACIILIKQLVQHPGLITQEVLRLCQYRKRLHGQCNYILTTSTQYADAPHFIREHPFFAPRSLLRAGLAAYHLFESEKDCLGRSIFHLAHDAGFRPPDCEYRCLKTDILGRTVTYFVCREGDTQLLAELLDVEADFDTCTATGMTTLHIATVHGHVHFVQDILKDQYKSTTGISPFSQDCSGRTFLGWAASCGQRDIVDFVFRNRYLWMSRMSNLKEYDEMGPAALRLASRFGHLDIVQCLLANDINPNMPDEMGRTAFWYATQGAHLDVMKCLEPVSFVDSWDTEGITPLVKAAMKGHLITIRFLLSLNNPILANSSQRLLRVDLHHKTNTKCTPLILAVKGRHKSCVKTLLQDECFRYDHDEIKRAISSAQLDSTLHIKSLLEAYVHHLGLSMALGI